MKTNPATAARLKRLEAQTWADEADSLLTIRQYLGICGEKLTDPATPEITQAAGEKLDRFFLEAYRCGRPRRG